MQIIAESLRFPEGPVCLPGGSFLTVEIRGQTLTRIREDGRKEIVAELPGGPNGAAIGPDGKCYICNNGGLKWSSHEGAILPSGMPEDYLGGWIERVDLSSGSVERVYERFGDARLRGPNDLVFDAHGGFWFTVIGKRRARDMDLGSVGYAKSDGSTIREVVHPLITPNGIGLSPDGKTLYVAETETARIWAWDISAPGEISRAPFPSPHGGRMLYASPFFTKFDSMAVESNGNICVASFLESGITVISPKGKLVEFVKIREDWFVTNICFGGANLRKAYITLSGKGQLVAMDWARSGLALNY